MELVEVYTQGISDDWHPADNRFHIVNRGYCSLPSLFDILSRFSNAARESKNEVADACLLLNSRNFDYLLRFHEGRLYLDNKNDPGTPLVRVEPETIMEYLKSNSVLLEEEKKKRFNTVFNHNLSLALSGSLVGSFIGLAVMLIIVLFVI